MSGERERNIRERNIRERAYAIWEKEGRPDGEPSIIGYKRKAKSETKELSELRTMGKF